MPKPKTINNRTVQFVVDEPNRIVAAIITQCTWDIITYISREYNLNLNGQKNARLFGDIQMPAQLKSVARCAPEDEFDVEIGKAIAFSKLEKKYWAKYSARMKLVAEHVLGIADNVAGEALKWGKHAKSINPLGVLDRMSGIIDGADE